MSYSITRISSTDTASAATFNSRISQISDALNSLDARIAGLSAKSAVIQQGVTIASDVRVGDIVYFSTQENACFKKALAALKGQPGSQGQSVEAPSSRVQGIVIATAQDNTTGTLLRCGYYQDFSLNGVIQDSQKTAGLYYLSPRVAGKITKNPGWSMRQPCISYYGDGKFSMITNYLAHDNHHHAYEKVNQFKAASQYTGTDTRQGTYVWLVNTDKIGELSPQTSVVFYKGELIDPSNFKIGKSTVWYSGTGIPDGAIYVFNVFPFAYGDSVVRSIGTNTLKLSSAKGAVQIDIPSYTRDAAVRSATAVSNIASNTLQITPVVSKITAGAGIYAAHVGSGQYVLASSKDLNVPIKAQQMYMNGAQRVATSLLTYTVFPKGIDSSITMSMPVQNNTSIPLKVYVWAQVKTGSTAAFTVRFYFIPLSRQSVVPIPTSSMYDPVVLSTNQSSTAGLLYCQVPVSGIQTTSDINTSGTLVASMQISKPASDVYIYQTGFRLQAKPTDLGVVATQYTQSQMQAAILDNLARVLTFNASY